MKPHYILIGMFAFVTGFAIQSAMRDKVPVSLPKKSPAAVSPSDVDKRYREITSIGQPGLELFFETTGRPGILYVYRTDCADCDAQWSELRPLLKQTPMLVVSFDDKRHSLAEKLAAEKGSLPFVPHHVPARRVLTVRTWLRDRGCGFNGTLPFTAITDGYGNCTAAWEGPTGAGVVLAAFNAMKNNNSSASASPLIP